MRPTLLNSCARAATAAEARYRINAVIAPSRAVRVVALDVGAEPILRQVAKQHWASARFFTCVPTTRGTSNGQPVSVLSGGNGAGPDIELRSVDGSVARLTDELVDVDVAVMLATADDGAAAAAVIGEACSRRGIMTAGLILGELREVGAAVSALRPHARVLMVSTDEHDVAEVLTALRA